MKTSAPRQSDKPIGRYAPSPTGRLHLGNIRTALAAWDDIRRRDGIFILRIEDTDYPRNVAGAEQGIVDDLRWIGIDWDEGPDNGGPAGPYRQSERDSIYRAALFELAAQGLIYQCACSRKDLQSAASAPHGPDGLIYPGTCRRDIPSYQIHDFLTEFLATPWQQRQACLRIRADKLPVADFMDEIHGLQRPNIEAECGDFVVSRRDGLWAYQFACAVDDAMMGITRVVRGDDLLSSAGRQAAIIRALGRTPPVYRHISLVTDETGARMSKRDGSCSLDDLRRRGVGPDEARSLITNMVSE